jgi:hypothetical protein
MHFESLVCLLCLSFLQYHAHREKAAAAAYSKAGDAATEVITSIRSVASFGGEHHELARYDNYVGVAMQVRLP